MLREGAFATVGLLFLLTDIRVFIASLYQTLFGQVSNNTLGLIAVAVFAAAALAPLVARLTTPRRAISLTALVMILATIGATASRNNWIDLILSSLAVIAGTWWLALLHSGRPADRPSPLPLALPLVILSDFALRHVFGTVPIVDLALPIALLLVLVGAFAFLGAGIATLGTDRIWTTPSLRGLTALVAVGPLLMVAETGLTNAAQVAASAGLGFGPEAAASTQIGALFVSFGLAAGVLALTRAIPHGLVGIGALLAGALLVWLHVPALSLAGGALAAAGVVIALAVLTSAPTSDTRAPWQVALALAIGWVLFILIGFAYHAFYLTAALWVATLAVGLAVVLALPFRTFRMAVAPAVILSVLGVIAPLSALLPFQAPPAAPPQAALRVMTYNVHGGFDAGQVPSLDALAETIAREAPDVLLLQEVTRGWILTQQHDVLTVLAKRLDLPYVWQPNIGDLYGNAILSRQPITDVRRVAYAKEPAARHQQRGALFARIGGILFVNTHLDEHADSSAVRQEQLRTLLRALDGSSPAVIAGDLNALPASAEIELLRLAGFTDLAIASGADQPTFPATDPMRRIDYIWGIGVTASQAHTVASSASDHRALVVNVSGATLR